MFSGVAALALLLVVGGIWIARDTQFVQETQTLKRLTNISLQDDTVFGRTVIWSLAWKGVKERPVLGWGQENFNLVFNTHYDPRMYDQEMWFDRTHNVVFDWLIAAGILGLLAYLSMYLAALWLLYKTTALTLVQKWLVFGLFVGYGFHNLTVFDNIISYVLFFSVLAWLYALSRTEEESSAGVSLSRKYEWGVVGGSILLAVCLMWLVNSAPFASAKGLLTSMRDVAFAQHLARNGDIEQALAQLDRGLSGFKETEALDTVGTQEVRERWVDTAKGFINDEWIPGEVKNTWYGGAVSAMLRQIEEVPDDARFHFLLASLHMEAGNLAVAQDTLKRALELSPRKQAILLHLVIVTNDLEGAESALPYAQQTFELEPENREARIIYGLILLRTGEVNTALSLLEEEPSAGLDNRILHELIRQQAFDDARAVWERGLKEEGKEDHRDSVFMLAQTYVGQGDLIRAAQEVSYIAAMYPSMQSIAEQALEEIKTLQQQ